MIFFAHRGASGQAPANSLSSFALARQLGATYYELDVHLSKDKQLVVHHDYNLGTDTTCPRDIREVPFEEIKNCRILHDFEADLMVRPPLLKEVMPVVMEELDLLNIEIKNDDNIYPGIEKILWQQISEFGLEATRKILFSSFDYPTLCRLRRIAPHARIGLLTRFFEPQKVLSLQAESVHINQTRITHDITEWCHANNRRIFVYTVNDKYTARQLEKKGVDGIFTDRLDLFLPQQTVLSATIRDKYLPVRLSKKTKMSQRGKV